jgi:uncharacterized membrane protein YtjA (UPF0391 family)
MLSWALMFLVIALIAALFGFTNVAGTSMAAAQVVFFVFLVLFVGVTHRVTLFGITGFPGQLSGARK